MSLSWARTIMRESIHAYVVAVTYNNLIENAEKERLLGKDWVTASMNYGHTFLQSNYLIPIADALQEYGIKNGYSLDRQFYDDMAWAGLYDTGAFKSMPLSEQTRIFNTIKIELTGKNAKYVSTPQKGKNAGC